MIAAKYNRVKIAGKLIEAGADVFAKDSCCVSPMHLASGSGHTDIMELLCAASKRQGKKVQTGQVASSLASSPDNRTRLPSSF